MAASNKTARKARTSHVVEVGRKASKVKKLSAEEVVKRFAAYSDAMFKGDFVKAKKLAGTFSLRNK